MSTEHWTQELPGLRPSTGLNIWLGIILVFTLIIAILAVIGVVALLKGG